jgi:hypothetical protein
VEQPQITERSLVAAIPAGTRASGALLQRRRGGEEALRGAAAAAVEELPVSPRRGDGAGAFRIVRRISVAKYMNIDLECKTDGVALIFFVLLSQQVVKMRLLYLLPYNLMVVQHFSLS